LSRHPAVHSRKKDRFVKQVFGFFSDW